MKISVLTATFNRGKYLYKLYNSLLDNMKYGLDIEWVIVDDGSTDDTQFIVKKFIEEKRLDIKYLYQENHGKMYAINVATKIATGELIVDCDSDDYFTDDAFKIISDSIQFLFDNSELYALCFLKASDLGKVSGNKFKENNYISTMFDLYFKDDICGEKILVFNSKIRKEFKHEIEPGEKFVTEARMYHKMDENYKIMCFNEIIEIGNYLDDGYTKNILKTYKDNPRGYYFYFKEILRKDLKGVKFRKKLYIIKNLLRWGRFFLENIFI